MKRLLHILLLLVLASQLSLAGDNNREYIQIDWYPLLTDSVGWNITCGGIALGFVDGGAHFNTGGSLEFSWLNVVGAKYNTGHGQRLSMGVGIDWRNYKLEHSVRFSKEGDEIQLLPYPADAAQRASRIKVFAIEIPVIFKQRLGKNIDVFVGEITNFNVHAGMKTKFSTSEGKNEEYTAKINQTPVTFDVIAGVNYKKIGAYFRYNPCRVVKKDYGPKFNTLGIGIVLGL